MSHDALIIFLVSCGFILFLLELYAIDQVGDELFNYWFKAIKRNIAYKRKKGKLPEDFVTIAHISRYIVRPHATYNPNTNTLSHKNDGYQYTIIVKDQNGESMKLEISKPTWDLLINYSQSPAHYDSIYLDIVIDTNSFTQMLIKGIDIQLDSIIKKEE